MSELHNVKETNEWNTIVRLIPTSEAEVTAGV